MIAYSVAERTQEMGIRIALGAERRDILRLVMRHGMALAAVGIAIGLAAALALTRLMATLLYRVSVTDLATFVAGPVLFLGDRGAGELCAGAPGNAGGPGDRAALGVKLSDPISRSSARIWVEGRSTHEKIGFFAHSRWVSA